PNIRQISPAPRDASARPYALTIGAPHDPAAPDPGRRPGAVPRIPRPARPAATGPALAGQGGPVRRRPADPAGRAPRRGGVRAPARGGEGRVAAAGAAE